jgi:putative aminopeptidase
MIKKSADLILIICTLAVLYSPCGKAQVPTAHAGPDQEALATWLELNSPPGAEQLASDVILKSMPDWRRDTLGNLILRKGSGSPRRVVGCSLDRAGFAVTEITESGFLRLREAGSAIRQHPLWVQFHEGQRILVLTRRGPVAGVVAVKSTHLQRGRVAAPVAALDDLWVDVGATSALDVARLGIEMLDPVVRDFSSWAFGDYVSGPASGNRVGCAAVAAASRQDVKAGETIFVMTVMRNFGQDGLESVLRGLGRIDELTFVDQLAAQAKSEDPVVRHRLDKPAFLPETTGLNQLTLIYPRTRFQGSLVETVQVQDAKLLLETIEKASGVSNAHWIKVPATGVAVARDISGPDAFSATASLLKSLADIPSVSGHESKVRQAILAALPGWASKTAVTDTEGNLVVEVGPNQDPIMFIAHQDEVGFEITSIADDGTVSLRTRGGLLQSLWEGQPALLHFDVAPERTLRGIFIPRESANTRQPEATTAWFGFDRNELIRLGVTPGLSVTADKHATRLGPNRFTARALDDRAGSTALILALRKLNPSTLRRRVIFAWSVREETGLEGAIALARRYGPTVKRVFSIDTFVSSDSPIESTRFAFSPLGKGAVIRGLDNSSVTPAVEIDRLQRIARAQRIPLLVGATNGGTDGSELVRYGAINAGLSWPGRYSHSPVEVLDLRDLDALVRVVAALATAPP